jgi:hypothetical protein
MPWNVRSWFRRRRPQSSLDAMPDVGQPPADAEPVVEPRLQDIGAGSYDLPLPTDAHDEQSDTEPESG